MYTGYNIFYVLWTIAFFVILGAAQSVLGMTIGLIIVFTLLLIVVTAHVENHKKYKEKIKRSKLFNNFKHGAPFFYREGDRGLALLILYSLVVKADRKVYNMEVNYVERLMWNSIEMDDSLLFKEILDKDWDVQKVCETYMSFSNEKLRLTLIYNLFLLAESDRRIDSAEVAVIEMIAEFFGIPEKDMKRLKTHFNIIKEERQQSSSKPKTYTSSFRLDRAYSILGLEKDAGEYEIKKSYRKLAMIHHPDRVIHMGERMQKAAKEKFQEIVAAYELICDTKGIQ